MILCGLVDTPNEQHNNDRFVPRKRHRDEIPDDSQYRQSQSRPALPFPRQDFENSTVLQNGNSDHLTGQLAIHRRSNLGQHPQTHDVAETNRNPSSSARWQYVEPSDGLNELVKQILKLYASSFDISVMKEAEGRLKTLMNAARHAPGSQAIAVVRGYFERLVRGGTFQLPAAELLVSALSFFVIVNVLLRASCNVVFSRFRYLLSDASTPKETLYATTSLDRMCRCLDAS